MVLFVILSVAMWLWPRGMTHLVVAPVLGAILGGFVWAMAMFASGCTMSLSSFGVWVLWGMALSVGLSLFCGKSRT